MMPKPLVVFVLLCPLTAAAQFPWPVTPLQETHAITGTFCEYRDTAPAPHYHNGTDIPKEDRSPVYPCADGLITAIDPTGSSAYVRVGRFAYVHIAPNPALSVGDSVFKSVTVLGTILDGLGHVHLTEGQVGSEVNALRKDTGLTPYVDTWAPVINFVKLFLTGSNTEFTAGNVSSRVDIVAHISERNGPPGSSNSVLNNGAYKVGYRILTASRDVVVYLPPTNGVRFQFDRKPSGDVHYTFHPTYSSTSMHVYYVSNTANGRSYWDTETLPPGNYTLHVFAEDTYGNVGNAYVPVQISKKDLLAPARPLLLAITNAGTPRARWLANNEVDLRGYRLYVSPGNVNAWQLAMDETALPGNLTSTSLALPAGDAYYRLTAVDTTTPPNESPHSDVYGLASSPRPERILVVDGFDRYGGSGSWSQPWHYFVFHYGDAIAAAGFAFESCANDEILSGAIKLEDYQAVFWLLGDESTTDETFSSVEQARVQAYLQQGGRLFVSGSEVAWDLDTAARGSASDEAFLRDYLKADYVADDANNTTVTGEAGSIFAGMNFTYGSLPYIEDYPDAIAPVAGSTACLRYGNGQIAGVQFEGLFPGGARPGRLVYLGFPFETIAAASARAELMQRVLAFFFPGATAVASDPAADVPREFVLYQNYPNPFNPSTTIRFGLPASGVVHLEIYDVLGRLVHMWPARHYAAGVHEVRWDGRNQAGAAVASGEYLLRLRAEGSDKREFRGVSKLSLLR
ncbi:MAG: T9SS type A sorting domain-containing protein [candidate division KSB1 bacterium]|nr:T9SS type A sorting domain-containing protein [candidate division KSB1 bacterium]MDZ7275703.1 T9SS type A sorting domain-containing protein [candidate division KSB1 bacterium]MDZ7284606.1 T9SS type A sorting domain-containing protein [candidate division KSB1 bacterium]MDZ7297975.1 T9SS type A sorting domain-containing protein [candidate division KSB1 bacterium]MDZ7305857.1 T9SS type A sorting domain-containing protein [candidate division KSB1 bacterium]